MTTEFTKNNEFKRNQSPYHPLKASISQCDWNISLENPRERKLIENWKNQTKIINCWKLSDRTIKQTEQRRVWNKLLWYDDEEVVQMRSEYDMIGLVRHWIEPILQREIAVNWMLSDKSSSGFTPRSKFFTGLARSGTWKGVLGQKDTLSPAQWSS